MSPVNLIHFHSSICATISLQSNYCHTHFLLLEEKLTFYGFTAENDFYEIVLTKIRSILLYLV